MTMANGNQTPYLDKGYSPELAQFILSGYEDEPKAEKIKRAMAYANQMRQSAVEEPQGFMAGPRVYKGPGWGQIISRPLQAYAAQSELEKGDTELDTLAKGRAARAGKYLD